MNPAILFVLIICVRTISIAFGSLRDIYRLQKQIVVVIATSVIEVSLWLVIISRALEQIRTEPLYAIIYGIGFAIGSVLGVLLEKNIPLGNAEVVFFAPKDLALAKVIHDNGFAATTLQGRGLKEDIDVIFCYVQKREVRHLQNILPKDGRLFYTIAHGIKSSKLTRFM
ncbi:MAG: hypothetical protein KKD73_03345 [Proteobacteria bacterium]|nr:hypothetical protein [Pseudomonadota bacterium]MBU1640620.1 hypothetical protein [Pseudomonadota bacterium]